jgi:threonine dehydrogenase-like Zn-dependent dehydrogenase
MRAARYHGHPYQIAVDTIPRPTLLTSEDAIIRMTSTAICGSEMHIYHGIAGSTTPPWTMGHEGVGIVQEVGEAVQLVKPGDRVIIPCVPGHGMLEVEPTIQTNIYGYGADQNGNTDGMQGELID